MQKSLVDKFVISLIKSSGSKSLWKLFLPVLLFMTKMVQWCQGREQTKTIRWKSVPAKGM
jgi:hypothetical protein